MNAVRQALQRAGAIWRNQRADGSEWLSGTVEFAPGVSLGIMIFENQDKNRYMKKRPAYTIFVEPQELSDVLAQLVEARKQDEEYEHPF